MKLLLLIPFLFSLSTFAEEADSKYSFKGKKYSISYEETETTQVIGLEGNLLSGIVENLKGYKQVMKLLKPDKDILVVLSSGGGYMRLFSKFEKAMKKACSEDRGCIITTMVPIGRHCASACIPFFMAGHKRIASAYSRFGFHQAAVIPGAIKLKGMAQKDLLKRGVNKDWIEENKKLFDSLTMTFLSPEEMEGSEIVTEITR